MDTITEQPIPGNKDQVKDGKTNNQSRAKDEPDSGDPQTTTTVFISKLSPLVDSAKLLQLSSAIGPVKEAFVVSDPATSKSRGFGYVRFVLREDAQTALKEGLPPLEPNDNPPLLTWAKPKLKPDQKTQKTHQREKGKASKIQKNKNPTSIDDCPQAQENLEESQAVVELPGSSSTQKTKNPLSKTKKDPFGNRIVVLQGLPTPPASIQETNPENNKETTENQTETREDQSDPEGENADPKSEPGKSITTKALFKKAKKLGKLESVKYPVFSPSSQSTAFAHLFFSDPTSAAIAQTKLHGHIFKGHFLTCALKSRLDALTRLGHAFGGRLIIRNLQFDITEHDLRYLFAPFGPIHSIDLPTTTVVVEGKPDSTRGRGFGFVWMLNQGDAEKAIEGLNGKKVYSGICQEAIRNETDGNKKSVKRKREKASDSNTERGRLIAVDWALGKQKYEEAQVAENKKDEKSIDQENHDDHDDSSSDDPSGSEDEAEHDDDESESDESSISEINTSSSIDQNHREHEIDDDDDDNKSKDHNDHQGTTLFVRNLSFEATEQELHKLFRPFGPIRYARIVMDPQLGRSRGTGFVCLWNKQDAQKVLDLVKKLESEGAGHGPLAANGLPSLLQPDPSSSLASQLSLHGRILGVSEAVSRERAEKLRVDRDKSGAGKDKRRLYLMREGVIFPNSNEAKSLHPADLAARQQSYDERKSLLRSNLSLYISYTRLSIRQLPLYVSERSLKRLARYALDQWRKEVKAGTRTELTAEELERELQVEPKKNSTKDDQANQPLSKKERKKKKGISSKVTQVKILRANEKIDGSTGLGKSKGYGFLELDSHQNALRVLRWANANPTVDKLLKEWTIEEIQNSIQKMETMDDQGKTGDKKEKSKNSSKENNDKNKENLKTNKSTDDRGLNDNIKRIEKLKVKLNELQSELDTLNKWSNRKKQKLSQDENSEVPTAGNQIKSHRMLIIEFAIENAQTVKKRLERKDKNQRGVKSDSRKKLEAGVNEEEEKEKEVKGRRKGAGKPSISSSSKRKVTDVDEKDESNNRLGRIISLKRKSKKIKRN